MHYSCSECGRPVGFMGDMKGAPQRYRCPHTGRIAKAQTPIRSEVKVRVPASDALPPRRVRHADKSKDLGLDQQVNEY